ncbi:MAG TPA: TolC family protein [Chthoniobacteraceae bacterium]|jgi:cobalt-zinc-cadmium efflux system outer membrane protein|nr:TolC family protein [Chthoniobacteraceae bacterium]
MKQLSVLALAALLAGCIVLPHGNERVSAGLERRAHHRLQSAPPGQFLTPRGVSLANGLTEDEAVAIALCNNAAFLETLADLGIARADVVQAGVVPNPTLTLLFPSGSKQLEFTAKLATEFLWLRPIRLKTAKLDYERTAELLVQNGLNLIRDTKLAFTEALAAERRLTLAEESAMLSAKIEKLARARVAAGDVSELEVGTVGIDTLQANEIVARAGQDVALARERLRGVLGLGFDRRPISIAASARPPRVRANADELVKIALASRPDLRAAEIGMEAAGARQGLAKAEIFTLSATLDANRTRVATNGGTGSRQRIEAGPGLDVGIPIFNQNQGGRARAKAGLEKAARGYVTVRDRIALEVREAHLRCLQAQQSYDNWHARILPPLEQAVGQSQQAYEAGNVAILLVLESTRKLTDARAKEAAAAVDLRRATAELERAIGGRLPGK